MEAEDTGMEKNLNGGKITTELKSGKSITSGFGFGYVRCKSGKSITIGFGFGYVRKVLKPITTGFGFGCARPHTSPRPSPCRGHSPPALPPETNLDMVTPVFDGTRYQTTQKNK